MSDPKEKRIGDFWDHGDGTASDTRTGLMWMRCALGQSWDGNACIGKASFYNLDEVALPIEFAGYSDWRLPTKQELQFMSNPTRPSLTVDGGLFSSHLSESLVRYFASNSSRKLHSYFGTSSPDETDRQNAWRIDCSNGRANSIQRSVKSYIRLVREGESFSVTTATVGSGEGWVVCSPHSSKYAIGSVVTLTATASQSSAFKCWHGDEVGSGTTRIVVMNANKTISAEFTQLKEFDLEIRLTGVGSGVVSQSPKLSNHLQGSTVKLSALPVKGSKFIGWHGDASGVDVTCEVTMDSSKNISAEFALLDLFLLTTETKGSGAGVVMRSLEADRYFDGTVVTLTASPAEGSFFSRWSGDVAGMDNVCSITVGSATNVIAEFEKVDIQDSTIAVELESIDDTSLSNGESAFIFYLNLWNKGTKQARLKYSMTSYTNHLGEEVEAAVYLSGFMKPELEKIVRAGTFQKIGSIYYKSRLNRISSGENLHISVIQAKPSIRIDYSFKCIDALAKTFVLVNTVIEELPPEVDPGDTMREVLDLKTQVSQLSFDLFYLKQKLELIENTKVNRLEPPKKKSAPVKTLSKILQWLATQEQIKVAELRTQLLPLDTLPSAVINELNEQALDLTGELALEENGNEIMVNQEILKKVLVNK